MTVKQILIYLFLAFQFFWKDFINELIIYFYLFNHLADAFIQSDLQMRTL